MMFRPEDPTISDGQCVNFDLIWDENQVDGPFTPSRVVTCFMTQTLVKLKYAKSPMTFEDMSFENFDLTEDLTPREDTEGSILQENDIFTQEANMEPVSRWMPPNIPLEPQEDYVQVRVTHIDENGQIVSILGAANFFLLPDGG